MQSFRCFPESPSHVTYRARLQGTSETESGSLISLIEEWVRGGADIIVTGLLITVDSECSVEISSFSEGECSVTVSPTPRTTTDSTDSSSSLSVSSGGLIGGIVAVILIIAVCITCTIVLAVILKYCRGNSNKNK